jgi:hypothetical protein
MRSDIQKIVLAKLLTSAHAVAVLLLLWLQAVTIYNSKSNLKALGPKEWDLLEEVQVTHPCHPQYEILGSTVSQW